MKTSTTPRVFQAMPSSGDFPQVGDMVIANSTIRTYLGSGSWVTSQSGIMLPANNWYVNSSTGSDANDGKTWGTAFATIAAAVAAASAGDRIFILGTGFSEAVTVSLAGLAIIGVGTGPNMATWTTAAFPVM